MLKATRTPFPFSASPNSKHLLPADAQQSTRKRRRETSPRPAIAIRSREYCAARQVALSVWEPEGSIVKYPEEGRHRPLRRMVPVRCWRHTEQGRIGEMLRVIVPTLNAAADWPQFAPALLACVRPDQVLLIDSESTDGTVELASKAGFGVCSIARTEFNHGGTRQRAAEMLPDEDILVYLTQDAVLAGSNELKKLIAAFDDPQVMAAYGRQVPRPGACAIEAHARDFNYPAVSRLQELTSRRRLGLKTIFMSNSFAAYRRSALMGVGGFPSNVIFGEDTITAANLILAGYKVAYVAEACVYHSHSYTWIQEFKRYFDIGVLHSRERWLLDEFGGANGEGRRFFLSELRYLLQRDQWSIPSALVRTGFKLLGYRLGRRENWLSLDLKRLMSMSPRFWEARSVADLSDGSDQPSALVSKRVRHACRR